MQEPTSSIPKLQFCFNLNKTLTALEINYEKVCKGESSVFFSFNQFPATLLGWLPSKPSNQNQEVTISDPRVLLTKSLKKHEIKILINSKSTLQHHSIQISLINPQALLRCANSKRKLWINVLNEFEL